jgi:hypothetical protein
MFTFLEHEGVSPYNNHGEQHHSIADPARRFQRRLGGA